MTRIRVHRPDVERPEVEPLALASRGVLPAAARLTLVDNGKPNARGLLEAIGNRVAERIPLEAVDVHTKPSAGAPLDADVTRMLAVRSHLVISGLGD